MSRFWSRYRFALWLSSGLLTAIFYVLLARLVLVPALVPATKVAAYGLWGICSALALYLCIDIGRRCQERGDKALCWLGWGTFTLIAAAALAFLILGLTFWDRCEPTLVRTLAYDEPRVTLYVFEGGCPGSGSAREEPARLIYASRRGWAVMRLLAQVPYEIQDLRREGNQVIVLPARWTPQGELAIDLRTLAVRSR